MPYAPQVEDEVSSELITLPTLLKSTPFYTSKWIDKKKNESLDLDWETNISSPSCVKNKIKIKKNSISKSGELKLELTQLNPLVGTFGQVNPDDDIELKKSVKFDIELEIPELTGNSNATFKLWFKPFHKTEWKEMKSGNHTIDPVAQKAKIEDAEVDNFGEFMVTSEITENNTTVSELYDFAENTFYYSKEINGYIGGNVKTKNGSKFSIEDGALKPPPGYGRKSPVTITMKIEKICDSEFQFTFDPSECTFNPSAKLTLSWLGLSGSNNDIHLYNVIGSGKYKEITPNYIDIKNNSVVLYIDHFSRYALSKGGR